MIYYYYATETTDLRPTYALFIFLKHNCGSYCHLMLQVTERAASLWFKSGKLMRNVNPSLVFLASLLSTPKKHPLYASPREQWRLARGEEESRDVK